MTDKRGRSGRNLGSRAATRLAVGFVLLTLASLVLVPLLVQRRVNELRRQIEWAEPARTLVVRLQFSLLREMSSLSEIVLSGDRRYGDRYRRALAVERASFDELRRVAGHLSPGVHNAIDRAQLAAREWHARVADEEILRQGGAALESLPRNPPLLEAALESVAAIDAAILEATATNREKIRNAEQWGIRLTLLLGALALTAAAIVGALQVRVRQFAAEAVAQRESAERALAESSRTMEARERLIRGVTHDVKNPLGAAKGYAELLTLGVKGPVAPEQATLVDGISRSVDNALTIITDLLDIARADAAGLALHISDVALETIVAEMVAQHRAAAETAGLTMTLVPSPLRTTLRTDPLRVKQVLGNLLSNAVKYTPAPGTVTVTIVRDDAQARILVTDTGPGIPARLKEAVFDEFTRADKHTELQGHGLGLAIARRIARLLGGDLTVEDGDGGGARFVFALPTEGERRGRQERRRG